MSAAITNLALYRLAHREWCGQEPKEVPQRLPSEVVIPGAHNCLGRCPLLGVKQTLVRLCRMSAYDPKRTLATRICRGAQCSRQHGRVWTSA
jgi:hypothetical protein